MSTSNEYWRIGRLLKPWGKSGEWLAAADSGDPRRFAGLARLFLRAPDGTYQPVTLESATVRGGRVMLKLMPEALCVNQAELFLPAAEITAAALADDLPYEHELIGATLADPAGAPLGVIRSLRPGPQGTMLVAECSGRERWIPYLNAYAPRFERAERRLRMDLPPGLVDDAEAVEVDPPAPVRRPARR
jgi:ribosomal 30S subunit maturation factor RimM